MKLHEAVDFLNELMEEDEISATLGGIYIEPPDPEYDSAEDDADEDGGTLMDLHHNQVNQMVEIEFEPRGDGEMLYPVAEEEELPTEPVAGPSKDPDKSPVPSRPWQYVGPPIDVPNYKTIPLVKNEHKWSRASINNALPIFPAANYIDCAIQAHEIFEKFFDQEILEMICDESNRYAVLCNHKNPGITVDELKVFFGILIAAGYGSNTTDKRKLWARDSDLHNEMVANAMSRDRFYLIERSIHFASKSDIDPNDKMWKLRPLTDKLQANFMKNFHPEQALSYDESMIAYFGRHSCKQFIKGKPLRFGYKVWCLNTPEGYCVSFEVYQGQNPRIHPELGKNYGKCVAPLLQMIHCMPPEIRDHSYSFYFDNLFTGIAALQYLKSLGYNATGTIRENRIPKNNVLKSNAYMNKAERGSMCSGTLSDLGICVTKWTDNKCVAVASTVHGVDPISTATRFSREERKRIQLERPNAVACYNKYMGGTDRMDQNISYHRIGIRKKKWWWAIFTWLLDVSVQNAWLLQRRSGINVTQLQFRRNIAQHYCNSVALASVVNRAMKRARLPEEDRFDGRDHVPVKSQRRHCAYDYCNSQVRIKCQKCDVALCVDKDCYRKYHYTV